MNGSKAKGAGRYPSTCVIKASPAGARTLTALAALAAMVPQDSAEAQEAGSFRIVKSYVRDYSTIEHADHAFTGGTLAGTTTIVESSGPPFAVGGTGLVECLVFARVVGDAIDLQAPCTVTDDAGDELHFVARRRDGDATAGGGGTGVFEITGGTGRHAGLSGECPYETRYLAEDRVVLSATCSWKAP